MIILHVTDLIKAEGNGVAVAVNNYVKYESKDNEVAVYNLDNPIQNDDIKLFNYKEYNKIIELPEPFCHPDIVVFNEVYKPKYIKLYEECVKKNIKYIIIPHGCMVKEAQKKHALKKFIGNMFFFNKFIKNADAIQFLNENESKNSHLKYNKCIIAGNGVEKPRYKNNSDGINKDLIFIGRYEIKHKGLDLLVRICIDNYKWFKDNNIKVQLYGRDSGNELKILNQMICDNNVDDVLIVNGPVYGNDKEKILKKAYAFVQCSRYEGQPMGIIEALSVGVPCIVTYGTYLGEFIHKNECGIACSFSTNEVFEAIKQVVMNCELRNQFAKNAYEKSNVEFSWDTVIEETLNKYNEIIKGDRR